MNADAEIFGNIPYQTNAIRVIADDALRRKNESIHCAGILRTLSQLIRHGKGFKLKRHSDISTLKALGNQGVHRASKIINRRQHSLILNILARQFSKGVMNDRRFAMRNRVANNGVKISH